MTITVDRDGKIRYVRKDGTIILQLESNNQGKLRRIRDGDGDLIANVYYTESGRMRIHDVSGPTGYKSQVEELLEIMKLKKKGVNIRFYY